MALIPRPILTPKSVLPLFFIISIIFAPIGGLLLYASNQVNSPKLCPTCSQLMISKVEEIVLDYSKCLTDAPLGNETSNFGSMPADSYQLNFKTTTSHGDWPTWRRYNETVTYMKGQPTNDSNVKGGHKVPNTPVCSIRFKVPNDIGPPVLMYYRLTNFYQNHRRYVKSLDMDQLLGHAVSKSDIDSGSCDPLKIEKNGTRPYYPCGLVANSMFNDTYTPPVRIDRSDFPIGMTDQGIAWASDSELYGVTQYSTDQIAVPPNWVNRWGKDGYTSDNGPPNLKEYEAFQVWMRTAGLPTFSKLAYRLVTTGMSSGTYQIAVHSSMYAM